MDLWRISRHHDLSGEGGRLAPARWNSGGDPVVYLAACPPGALIEILVHLEIKERTAPMSYTLFQISTPLEMRIVTLAAPEGEAWKTDETSTRSAGDAWLKSNASALAQVPSAILPETFNYLLNPLHPDAARVKIAEVYAAVLDGRLGR